jgi:hypothetical protein
LRADGSGELELTAAVDDLEEKEAQGASSNEVTMETSVGRLESLGQVGFEGN